MNLKDNDVGANFNWISLIEPDNQGFLQEIWHTDLFFYKGVQTKWLSISFSIVKILITSRLKCDFQSYQKIILSR